MFKRLLASKHVQQRIRWIMGLLAATLIIPLVIFFHATGRNAGAGPGGSAGEIFGHQVPWEEFQAEYQTLSRYLQEQLGKSVSLDMFEPMLREQTWDRLLLREDARRHIRIPDDELARFIRQQSTFQRNGVFSQDLYYRFVQATNQNPQQFETRVRDDLRLERLLESLKSQVSVRDEDTRASYAKEYERMRAALIFLDGVGFRSQVERLVTDDELRAFYISRQENLRIPAKRILAYLGLSLADALAVVPPASEEAIAAYYHDHPEEFTTPQGAVKPQAEVAEDIRTRVREDAARKRLTEFALDLQDDLDAKHPLEDIAAARKLSIRTIGPIEAREANLPNGLTASMINDAFEVGLNQTTGLLRETTGVFLLKPTTEIPSRVPTFEEVRADLRQQLIDQHSREAALAHAKQVHEEVEALRQMGKSFEDVCALLGLHATRPEPFTKQGSIAGVPGSTSVPAALFRLNPGELSDVLRTSTGAVLGLVEERLPFDEAQFAKDRDTYRTTVLERKQQDHINTYLQTLRAKARLKSYLEKRPTQPL